MACTLSDGLVAIFGAIDELSTRRAEKEYLRSQAVVSVASQLAQVTDGSLALFEKLTHAAITHLGPKASVAHLQNHLKAVGRPDLSRRAEKIAKARRCSAHPHVFLLESVTIVLSGAWEPLQVGGDDASYQVHDVAGQASVAAPVSEMSLGFGPVAADMSPGREASDDYAPDFEEDGVSVDLRCTCGFCGPVVIESVDSFDFHCRCGSLLLSIAHGHVEDAPCGYRRL